MIFFDILSNLLTSHNVTQKQLAEFLQIRQNTISDWKKNGNLPSGETAIKIANFFNVSLDYLLTGEEKNNVYSPDEIELISNYRSLQEHDKSTVRVIISAIAKNS